MTLIQRAVNARSFACWAIAASLIAAAPAVGDDSIWINVNGGSFHSTNNWLGGAVPGESDTAIFPNEAFAFVGFGQTAAVTDRLIVRHHRFFFSIFDTTYTLLNPSINTPSIVIGEQFGDEAELSLLSGTLVGVHMMVGSGHGAFGVINVGDEDDEFPGFLSIAGYLGIGQEGDGTLHLHHGHVETNFSTLGAQLDSSGEVVMQHADSSWTNLNTLTVGDFGDGMLAIRDGAQLSTGSVIVAQNVDSFAAVLVEGAGSSMDIVGNLDIGLNGTGDLQVRDGATVTVSGFCTAGLFIDFSLTLGCCVEYFDPAVGTIAVSGEGSSLQCDGPLYGGLIGAGHAEIMVSDGAELVAEVIELVSGIFVPSILGGDGTIISNVEGFGDIAPGAPIGELTILGNVEGLDLQIEVAGTTNGQFDRLVVSGSADFNDETLVVELVDPYVPSPGDSFEIVTAGNVVGQFAEVIGEGLPPTLAWSVAYGPQSVTLTVIPLHPADLDNSGAIDAADLAILLGNWGRCPDPEECIADLNGDGMVGAADLAILLGNWGEL